MKNIIRIITLYMVLLTIIGCFPDGKFHTLIDVALTNQSSYDVDFFTRRVGEGEEMNYTEHGRVISSTSESFKRSSGYTYSMYCIDKDEIFIWGPKEVYIDFDEDYEWIIGDPESESYPSENCHVFNFENNYEDQYGIDNWSVKVNEALSLTEKKFGNYSLFAKTDSFAGLQTDSSYWTIGKSQSIGVWVKFIDLPVSGTLITAYCNVAETNFFFIKASSNGIGFFVGKNGTESSSIYTTTPIDGEWHYVALSYNTDTNICYGIVDNNIIFFEPSGTWGTGYGVANIMAANNDEGIRTFYMDEACFAPDQYIHPDTWVQHYNHNIPWGAEYIP